MSPTRPVKEQKDYIRDSDPKKAPKVEPPTVLPSTEAAIKQLLGDNANKVGKGRRR